MAPSRTRGGYNDGGLTALATNTRMISRKIAFSLRRAVVALTMLALMACSDGGDAGNAGVAGRASEPVAVTETETVSAEPSPSAPHEPAPARDARSDVLVARYVDPFTGDLDEMRDRRTVRVLVTYSKTNFFLDGAEKRGATYDLVREFEKQLNEEVKKHSEKVRLVYVPLPFDELLPALAEGRGDIAAAGLTVTPQREELVAFSDPLVGNVKEVVVTHRSVGNLSTVEDLAGRRVYVRPGSSYGGHLRALSARLEEQGRRPIEVIEGDSNLSTEDILELVNSGVLEVTVCDDHIADLWAQVFPEIVVHEDLAVHEGGMLAWAVRKNNPKLLARVNAFVADHKKGTLLGNILLKRYYADNKWIKNPVAEAERRKFDSMVDTIRKYSEQYGFHWLAIAAQGYQESGLDQGKRSPAGAIGVMQLLPSTAADKNVGIRDIEKLEDNIHAGVKYLGFLRDRYFSDPQIPAEAQVDFAWAAYNAGPARVAQLRERARERGLDPNRWFFNVERIAAEVVGRETVDYVANINKYYVAYRLMIEGLAGKDHAMQRTRAGG